MSSLTHFQSSSASVLTILLTFIALLLATLLPYQLQAAGSCSGNQIADINGACHDPSYWPPEDLCNAGYQSYCEDADCPSNRPIEQGGYCFSEDDMCNAGYDQYCSSSGGGLSGGDYSGAFEGEDCVVTQNSASSVGDDCTYLTQYDNYETVNSFPIGDGKTADSDPTYTYHDFSYVSAPCGTYSVYSTGKNGQPHYDVYPNECDTDTGDNDPGPKDDPSTCSEYRTAANYYASIGNDSQADYWDNLADQCEDKCPNMPGVQTSTSQCSTGGPDVCPNINGNQSSVPSGYVLQNGQCVQDACPNMSGVQTSASQCPGGGGGGGGGGGPDMCPNITGVQASASQCPPGYCPAGVDPGESYTASNTRVFTSSSSFTVPTYTTLSVDVYGAGGGGAGDGIGHSNGTRGGDSSFNTTLIGRGGGAGIYGTSPSQGGTYSGGDSGANGGNGIAGSGQNFAGGTGGAGAPTGGGAGGVAAASRGAPGNAGSAPGGGGSGAWVWFDQEGGGGGGGGRATKTYAVGALTVGASVPVTVGSGGAGGNGWRDGGNGARGEVRVTWTGTFECPETTITTCPAGQILRNGVCEQNCFNECSGADVVNSCDGEVVTTCSYQCNLGICTPPPPAEVVTWTVSPLLVQRGSSVSVTWEVRNVSSCSVTRTNGSSWSGASGNRTDLIQEETIYTLSCLGLDGDTVTRTSKVRIVPTFQEV